MGVLKMRAGRGVFKLRGDKQLRHRRCVLRVPARY